MNRLAVAVAVVALLAANGVPAAATNPTAPRPSNASAPGILSERQISGIGTTRSTQRPSTPSTTTCGASWRVVDSPNGTWNNILGGVSAASGTDIWAVGSYQDPTTGFDQNLAEVWDGYRWSTVLFPQPNTSGGNDLTDVFAVSATDAYASGLSSTSNPNTTVATAYHWDGSSWSQMTPPPAGGNSGFNQVSGSGAGDIWFAGFQDNSSGTHQTLLEHWDGAIWTQYMPTSPGGSFSVAEFISVAAISSSDVWVVGYWIDLGSTRRQTLVEHWNGTGWDGPYPVDVPVVGNTLLHVTAASHTDVLAVGYTSSGTLRQPLAAHWNGTAWSLTSSPPAMGAGDNVLEGLTQKSSTDAYAVGYWRSTNAAATQPLVEHWDGTSWTASAPATPATLGATLFSAAEPLPGDVWSTGFTVPPGAVGRTLVENYSGLTAPTGVIATPSDNSAAVSWADPCGDGGNAITSYRVTAYDGCTIQGYMDVSGAAATSLNYTGLTNGSPIRFTVAAINGFGLGVASGQSTAVAPNGPSPPSTVSACSATQYHLTGSNGSAWVNMDAPNLSVSFAPQFDSYAVISGNVDLWTANAGYNQDVGIAVSGPGYPRVAGQPEAWKESGGFAGTFSPNAAFVQGVIPVAASTTYTARLQWKANKPDAGSIFAGAGPIGAGYSPTRLTVRLVPRGSALVYSTSSALQYHLTGSDGSTWRNVDAANLRVSFPSPASGGLVLISGNADLWTSRAGFNQDLGVAMSGGVYPLQAGQPEAWQESGGFAGTFSPNAAYVENPLSFGFDGTTTFTATLQWKANQPDPGTIYAGAGPIGGRFSPTTLTVVVIPPSTAQQLYVNNIIQSSQDNSDGASWQDVPNAYGGMTVTTAASYLLGGNLSLWTAVAGYNQDIGIMVTGGAYGSGTVVAWKESGGYAGTFSPNAAYVSAVLHLQPGTYFVALVFKTNRYSQEPTAIFMGAGSSGNYSPTSLIAIELSEP